MIDTIDGAGRIAYPREASEAPPAGDVIAALLFELLLEVVRRHHPEIAPVLAGEAVIDKGAPPEFLARVFQAHGIWFQLLSIVEQDAAMGERRRIEKELGDQAVQGTFANVIAKAAKLGIAAQELGEKLAAIRVRPVITAHPTEAKRVTVLEKHRRIYRLLVELEQPRWTARERAAIIDQLRDEIELLWMTGELRLEKPSVEQEVAWGLHFFHETLFDGVPELLKRLDRALALSYPGERFSLSQFFQFGSWIGGDRDGNPFVTNKVTRRALAENAAASLRYYEQRLYALMRSLSIAERALPPPAGFREALNRALAESGDGAGIALRNPGEPYRQFLFCAHSKVKATLARFEGVQTSQPYYASADELIADLAVTEEALSESGSPGLAQDLVRPLRLAVEAFRFRTVRLDLRENTTRLTETLRALWRSMHTEADGEPPAHDSDEWKAWLLAELGRPRSGPAVRRTLPPEAEETLGMFKLARDEREEFDREAFGAFVLSMTRSVADILGAYLLAKEADLYHDATRVEACYLPITPLFETITDLRAAPAIMRELLALPLVRRSARIQGGVQEVMIGYSDSNKDGGFLVVELGAVESAGQTDQNRGGRRHPPRLFPRPRRFGEPRRLAHGPGDRGAARGLHQRTPARDRTRRGRLVQIRQQGNSRLSDGDARRQRVRAYADLGARGAGAARRIRGGDGGAVGRLPRSLRAVHRPPGPAHLSAIGEPTRRNLDAEHRLAPGPAVRRALAQRSARHSLGVLMGAEPPRDHRLVWRRQRHRQLHRRAQGARPCAAAPHVRRVAAVSHGRRRG